MRIPYAPNEPTESASDNPDVAAIYERIAARRNPRPLIPLDLALLHNPSIADGYSSLLGAIRTHSSLSQAAMELAICYIAVLNGAVYEWTAHAPLAVKAGVDRKKLEAVLQGDVKNTSLFSEEDIDVLEFTEQSTRNVSVNDDVFERIKSRFTNQQVMELTITVAGYNMVSRFLVALDVTESNGKTMVMPK